MQWQRMYVEGNEVSLGNYEKQFGLPNNLGKSWVSCDRREPLHALWRFPVVLRHEPAARRRSTRT